MNTANLVRAGALVRAADLPSADCGTVQCRCHLPA
jgi:hypothetical protein